MPTTVHPIAYGHLRAVNLSFDQAIQELEAALKKEGFGVLFQLDMKEKFKEKLGVDFSRYVILGACNPAIAYRAVQQEIALGLLLPCNAVVYEQGGRIVAGVVDASKMLSIVGRPEMQEMAEQVNGKLRRALESVPGAADQTA
jgi:uncharacterized protein (DUF302 family)